MFRNTNTLTRRYMHGMLAVAWFSGYRKRMGSFVIILGWAFGWMLISGGGCARRAYTEVYIENMAAEIRDLEDQLYEFDNEYRVLEQQLSSLQAENARLRNSLTGNPKSSPSIGESPQFLPKESTKQLPAVPGISPNRSYSEKNPVEPTPAPSLGPVTLDSGADKSTPVAPKESQPKAADQSKARDQQSAPGNRNAIDDPSGAVQIQPALPTPTPPTLPPVLPRSEAPKRDGAMQDNAKKDGAVSGDAIQLPGSSVLPAPKSVPGASAPDAIDLKNLAPPTIEHGEIMPPSLPPVKSGSTSPLSNDQSNDLEIELGKIEMPAQLALNALGEDGSEGALRLVGSAEPPRDARIVDIKFHPSLCRAINLDDQSDDDGLYLVLQPLNAAGQMVPTPGDLIVIALDPSREGPQSQIGRWTLSAADVKSKLEPIGASQGIHLSLPWNGPDPQADRLVVFAYYTLDDGRRIVAEHEVFLHNSHRQASVWVPRTRGAAAESSVRTASGQRPVR